MNWIGQCVVLLVCDTCLSFLDTQTLPVRRPTRGSGSCHPSLVRTTRRAPLLLSSTPLPSNSAVYTSLREDTHIISCSILADTFISSRFFNNAVNEMCSGHRSSCCYIPHLTSTPTSTVTAPPSHTHTHIQTMRPPSHDVIKKKKTHTSTKKIFIFPSPPMPSPPTSASVSTTRSPLLPSSSPL